MKTNTKNSSWGKDNTFYKRKSWLSLRDLKLDQNPLCELCNSVGIITPAVYADHILNRKLFPEFELDIENIQSLCPTCHSQKTKIELIPQTRKDYLKELDSGKLQYICTSEAKKMLLEFISSSIN